MHPARRFTSLFAVLMMLAAGFASAAAQDATPTADSAGAPNAGAPLPGQFAFYPSEVAQPGGDLPGDPQIQLVRVGGEFAEPVNVASPKDGTGRIFVVERGGTIQVVNPDGTVQPEPFLSG